MTNDERIYEEICVNCPSEKYCHDTCEVCDEYLERLNELEEEQ